MKSSEQFNPYNAKYKKVADLPKEEQDNFTDVEDGGFVRKEAAEKYLEAEKLVEIANVLKKEKLTPQDILHAEGLEEVREREQIIDSLKYYSNKGYRDEVQSILRNDVTPELRADKSFMMDAIQKVGGWMLEHASIDLQDDKDVVLTAVKEDGYALRYASKRLQADKEIALAAVRDYGSALQYASEELKSDRELVLEAVKNYGYLRDASEDLRGDKEVVMAAKKIGGDLQYLSEKLRSDKEVVLRAVNEDAFDIVFASKELQEDKDVAFAALKNNVFVFDRLDDKFRADKEIIFYAIKKYGEQTSGFFKLVSEDLRNDRNFVLEAIEIEPSVLKHISEEFRNDKEVVMKAMMRDGYYFRYASEELKHDKDFIMEAIQKMTHKNDIARMAWHVPEEIRSDQKFILEAVKINSKAIEIATEEIQKKILKMLE